jgi:hypothetical protein
MTSKDDIKGLESLKFLRPCSRPSSDRHLLLPRSTLDCPPYWLGIVPVLLTGGSVPALLLGLAGPCACPQVLAGSCACPQVLAGPCSCPQILAGPYLFSPSG